MDVQSFYSLQEHMGHHYTGSDANESLPDLDDWMKELKRVTRERTAQRRKSPTDPSSKDSRRRSTVDCHERCEPAACERHKGCDPRCSLGASKVSTTSRPDERLGRASRGRHDLCRLSLASTSGSESSQ